MTREEAIKLVKEVTGMSLDWDDAHYDALQMAIKALEQEPCEDTISRQDAIDVIMGEPTDAHYPSWYAERLEQLPSVQRKELRWEKDYYKLGN